METSNTKQSIPERITNVIIEKLEAGVIPWENCFSALGRPKNFLTGHYYTGINFLLLSMNERPYPFYLTFDQIKQLGGRIKQGAKGQMIVFAKTIDNTNKVISTEDGDAYAKRTVLKHYYVFNVDDITGIKLNLPLVADKPINEKIETCEQILASTPKAPEVVHLDSTNAFYNKTKDFINMPFLEQFVSSEFYYLVLFHELVHATGHESRLNRSEVTQTVKFGDPVYSQEELTAELGASMLATFAGISSDRLLNNSAAYIQGWLKVLKDDKSFIIRSASKAQQAFNYIIG